VENAEPSSATGLRLLKGWDDPTQEPEASLTSFPSNVSARKTTDPGPDCRALRTAEMSSIDVGKPGRSAPVTRGPDVRLSPG
jgi:hypothetical protein